MRASLSNVTAFGQRARQIREEIGIPLVQLYGDAHLLQDWKCILVCVEPLTDNGDALYGPRAVCRLLTVLDQVPTVDEMKQVCSNIGHESQASTGCG